jgi:uncharacterized protein
LSYSWQSSDQQGAVESNGNTAVLAVVLAIVAGASCSIFHAAPLTAAKESSPGNYSRDAEAEFTGVRRSSFYLPMRDGVKIATDLYLPRGLKPGQKIPTILVQNRYGRLIEPRAPFRWFFLPISGCTRLFVRRGYAWVETDVRGSAASFGSIPYPWSPDEIRDGDDVVNWIVHQPWSDGKVGTTGTSYVGVSAEMLLANRNPAVKAAAPMFAWWDTYTAETFPGGIYLSWLIPRWARIDDIVDHDAVWEMGRYKWYTPFFISGIAPVEGDRGLRLLREAIAQHNNVDVSQFLSSVTYRDDILGDMAGFADGFDSAVREHMKRVFDSGGGVIELSNPARYKAEIEASGAAIYNFDGWFDGPTCRSAIRRFLDLSNPQKIILGPWIHAVTRNVETGRPFDDDAERLRFFDYELKGVANGVMEEPRVTYYTMVEDKWKTAARWPLPNQTIISWYLGSGHTLTRVKPETANAWDTYTVDYTAGTGHHTRWEPLIGGEFSGGSSIVDYADRSVADSKLLVYDTPALSNDIEVTGHPIVILYVTSTAHDGEFLAYLEDVAPDRSVKYVTEGALRAIDRKLCDEKKPFYSVVPCHSFLRKDREPLVPGETAEIRFDLYPISYLFRAGHSMRLTIAGADKDHFPVFPGNPPTLRFARAASDPSRIDLPVIPR